METSSSSDNTGDCQAAAADSTTTTTATFIQPADNDNIPASTSVISTTDETQQVTSTTATTATVLATAQKLNSSPPNSTNNKTKSQQQQQTQQQQQHYQFRAPQQFVKHKKSTSTLAKKNKTWNKRQNKTAKQQQQQQQLQQNAGTNAIIAGVTVGGGAGAAGAGGGGGINVNAAIGINTLASTKADVENIQNLKNQLGGHHYYHHYGHHGHRIGGGGGNGNGGGGITSGGNVEGRGTIGNGLPPASLAVLEKLGYGHGHLKQPLYKKIMMHRGHHHVLCAGAAHNTIGGGVNATCCLINGCNGHSGKDISGGGGAVGAGGINAHNNSNSTSAANVLHYCCGRSKFFLPDKRPRKEVIVPPTKFLLGGNISDPLNLNSLQNEASNASSNNNTPATTPRQSPITTPPKVEVIIPPNIHDPLHLLDPVDSMEYEKQLTSPMKRCLRGPNKPHKHRHRKNRKPKRRRHESYNSTATTLSSVAELDDTSSLGNSTMSTEAASSSLSISVSDSNNSSLISNAASGGVGGAGNNSCISDNTTAVVAVPIDERKENVSSPVLSTEEKVERNTAALLSPHRGAAHQQHASGVAGETNVVAGDMLARERVSRDLRLELNSTTSSTCGSIISGNISGFSAGGSSGGCIGIGSGGGGGRKRKVSESNNSQKNKKFHRLDSMDKIVSPVVPQPGAWKRPPRSVPCGARKPSRRSTSVSEPDLLSPIDEAAKLLFEAEAARVETPDFSKLETTSEVGLSSPLSTTSGTTSVAAGEQESLVDTSTAENAATVQATLPADESSSVTNLSTTTTQQATINTAVVSTTATASATTTSAAIANALSSTLVQLTKMPKFRAEGAKYRYGNYERYSGLRNINEFVDVRLQVFERHLELFQNKDIIDIGCNVGHMTIAVARNLAPKSILGIDIDRELIARARRNLNMYVRIPEEQIVKKEYHAPKIVGETSTTEASTSAATATSTAPTNLVATAAAAVTANAEQNQKSKKTRRKRKGRAKDMAAITQAHYFYYHLLHHHHHYHNNNYRQQKQQKLQVGASELFPISFPLTYGGIPTPALIGATDTTSPRSTSTPGHPSNASSSATTAASISNVKSSKNDFPRNVFFRQTNYVLKDESQLCNDSQQYDLIMCLSVTKWIHLNFGDAGLKLAFKRMFNQLRPGGKLILEAQNWASYKKKKNLTEEIYKNYNNIEFFPNKFHEYLLSSEVGFSHSYTLGVPRHLSKGFCRPIQLYAKGDYTPNHVRWSDAYYPQTPYEAYRGIYATMPPRPAGIAYPMSSTRSQAYDTPHYTGGTSGPYSSRQTPMHQPTSQYYNPLETDSYLPSYDMEYLNHMYVFASPLYQTVWSPPASLRNSSSHTPVFGSVRDAELDGDGSGGGGGGSYHRHVYPPNDDTSSPNANAGGAFNSIRDADTDDSNQLPASNVQHVYATNCGESSSSPQVLHHHHDSETIDGLLDEEPAAAVSVSGLANEGNANNCCDLNEP